MAEFGANVTEAPETPAFTTPKQGQVKEPVALQGLTNIFQGVREMRAGQREQEDNAFVSRFTNQQLATVQAVDQGKLSSQFARTKMRKNVIDAINNYPSLRDEILKANSSIIGQAGMGSVVTEGTKEEVRREQLRTNLVESGQVSPDADEETFRQAEENWQLSQEAKRRFDAEMETIRLERAKTGLTKEKIELLDKRQSVASERFLTDTAPAFMDGFKQTAESILSLKGKEGYDDGTVVSLIEERWNEFEQQMSVPLSKVDSHQAQALMKGYREFKDIVLKRAKGEFTQEAYKRQIDQISSRQQLLAMNNKTIAKAAALSDLGLNDLLIPQKLSVSEAAADFLGTNLDDNEQPANVFTDSPTGRRGLESYLKTIGQDNLNDDQKAEQSKHLQRIFEGVEDYEGVIRRNPQAAIELTNWMSTQKFYNLRKDHPEVFSNTDTAMRVLQANYGDEVWGMIKRQFRENKVYVAPDGKGIVSPQDLMEGEGGEMVPTDSLVAYKATNGGVEFVPLKPDMNESVGTAKRLNDNLAPIINKTVRAFAHLEGNQNYKDYFERAASELMTGGMGSQDAEGSQGADELRVEDYAPVAPIATENLPEDVQADTEFLGEVNRIAEKLDMPAANLLGIMDFETGGTFNPAQKNAAGSSGTGLIQFMAKTAKSLGTSTKELAKMTRTEQLQWVERYLDQYGDMIQGASVEDVYMSVLYPKAIGKSPDYTLFTRGSKAYTQNRGLDTNRDGKVSKAEASSKVKQRTKKYT